jgi:hypothetical protein
MECSQQMSVWNVPINCLYGMFLSNICMECSCQTAVWNVSIRSMSDFY